MDFIKSHFGKLQLVRVAFFRSDFLQNPYFSIFFIFKVKLPKIVLFQILQMENVMMNITHLIVTMITENAVEMLICPFALIVFAKTLQIPNLEVMYFF